MSKVQFVIRRIRNTNSPDSRYPHEFLAVRDTIPEFETAQISPRGGLSVPNLRTWKTLGGVNRFMRDYNSWFEAMRRHGLVEVLREELSDDGRKILKTEVIT